MLLLQTTSTSTTIEVVNFDDLNFSPFEWILAIRYLKLHKFARNFYLIVYTTIEMLILFYIMKEDYFIIISIYDM